MIKYLESIWSKYYLGIEETEGVFSGETGKKLLEGLLATAEEKNTIQWHGPRLFVCDVGVRELDRIKKINTLNYTAAVDESILNAHPSPNENGEYYLRIMSEYCFVHNLAGFMVDEKFNFELHLYDKQSVLGEAKGKRIERLFENIGKKFGKNSTL